MKRHNLLIGFVCLMSWFSINFGYTLNRPEAQDLPAFYKKWLERDAAYIISAKEREVFLKLQTDKERDIFIEAFWKQRNPNPETPENEFKAEHYRRIAYADKFFGRDTTRPGWQTDRGRMFILLGPPNDVARVEGEGTVFSCEIWYYDGKIQYGLPPHFTLLFFRRDGVGEYVLYSPMADGPSRLLINYHGDPTRPDDAYERIKRYDSRLAQASLSNLPEEIPFLGRPSLSSEMLFSRIGAIPDKMVDSRYAEALLKFKEIVEVEYTANYIASDGFLRLIRDEEGQFFIHYAIEPKTLSVLSSDEKYRLNFKLNGILTDAQGRTVFQYEKNLPVDFNKSQIEDIGKTSLELQDMIPVIPGDYVFNLLLKNTFSKEFTSLEGRVSIPREFPALQMSPLLLGYQLKKTTGERDFNKPFKVGSDQISCQSGRVYHPRERMVVFFQVYGPDRDIQDIRGVRYSFLRDGKEIHVASKEITPPARRNFVEEFPLTNFPPGIYQIKGALVDVGGREIFSKVEDFEITPVADVPRPWIVSKVLPPSKDKEYSFILGQQYFQTGDLKTAEGLLKKAYEADPAALKYALAYGQALLAIKDYQKVKNVLLPFAQEQPGNSDVLSLLGLSCQALGEYQDALRFYQQYLSHAGMNLIVLNALGECYYRLGNFQEALGAWEKSLEINPNQGSIKKLVSEIRQKK